MVEIEHTPGRVYACLVVHGAPVFVRFDNEHLYDQFRYRVSTDWRQLMTLTGYDSCDVLVRPAAVDIISKGAKPE